MTPEIAGYIAWGVVVGLVAGFGLAFWIVTYPRKRR